MPGTLVSIDAWNRRTSSRETVRVGSALNSVTLGSDGFTWEPALRRAPRLSMQLADADLTGAVQVGQAEFALNAKALKRVTDWRDLDWSGSTVRIYSGDSPFLSTMNTELIGRIYSGVTDANTGVASLQLEADRAIVDVPLLTRTYAGTGGAEGDPELRGNFKPAGWGNPINVPPVLINAALFIYQVDAYGSLLAIADVFEDLAAFGPSQGDYATYDALSKATLGGGQWATCIALGLFRLGAAPTGTITCDPVCQFGQPGDMMLRWLRTHAGVVESRIRASTFAALTAAVQIITGSVPRVSHWTTDEGNVLDLMQRMCASCNAVPLLLLDGTIAVSRVIGGGTAVTLKRQGGTPPVTGWLRQESPVPWWRMRMTAARAFYVNSPSEIDYEDDIRLKGGYSADETYRQGDVVIASDGAQYLFINPTPTKGTAPPNSSYWDLYTNAPDATQIKYPSGYTLAEKEPAEKDATSGAPAGTNVGGIPAEQLIDNVARIAADDWLSTAEKPQVILAYKSLESEWNSLDARYRALGSPADITPARDAAATKFGALGTYLVNLSPGWSDVNYDTRIVPDTYRARWGEAYVAVADFNAAITGRKGDPGADGRVITVAAAPLGVRFSPEGAVTSGPVTFIAQLVNVMGPPSFSSAAGHQLYGQAGVTFNGNSMTITADRIRDVLNYNNMQTGYATETIIASASGISGQITVTKIQDGKVGADGKDSTVPGPPGRPAVNFRQDATPVGAMENDTWVRVTEPKTWRQLIGGQWVPMLGAASNFDKLTADYLAVDQLSAVSGNIGFLVSYNGLGGRVERDGNGTRIYYNDGSPAVQIGF